MGYFSIDLYGISIGGGPSSICSKYRISQSVISDMYVRWSVADPDVGIRVPISKTRVKIAGKFCHQIFQLIWDARKNGISRTDPTSIIMEHMIWYIWILFYWKLSSDSKKKSLSRHTSPNVFQQNIHDSTSKFPLVSNNEDVCFQ